MREIQEQLLKDAMEIIKTTPWHYDLGLDQPDVPVMYYDINTVKKIPKCATVYKSESSLVTSICFREFGKYARSYKGLPASYRISFENFEYSWHDVYNVYDLGAVKISDFNRTEEYKLCGHPIRGDNHDRFLLWCAENGINPLKLTEEDKVLIKMKWDNWAKKR